MADNEPRKKKPGRPKKRNPGKQKAANVPGQGLQKSQQEKGSGKARHTEVCQLWIQQDASIGNM